LIVLTGRAVLRSLRRFASRLDPIVELEPLVVTHMDTAAMTTAGSR
jgi:hypothetical protein